MKNIRIFVEIYVVYTVFINENKYTVQYDIQMRIYKTVDNAGR